MSLFHDEAQQQQRLQHVNDNNHSNGNSKVNDNTAHVLRGATSPSPSSALRVVGAAMLGIIKDLDRLLSSDRNYLLGTRIAAARAKGTTDVERALYERNARDLITVSLVGGGDYDYGATALGGLVGGYYLARWGCFLDHMYHALDSTSGNTGHFNKTAFDAAIATLGHNFVHGKETYPTHPTGDTVSIAAAMLHKYKFGTTQQTPGTRAGAGSTTSFKVLLNTDVTPESGNILAVADSLDLGQLRAVCTALGQTCRGFSSSGVLYKRWSATHAAAGSCGAREGYR